jgi:hypothetical protein
MATSTATLCPSCAVRESAAADELCPSCDTQLRLHAIAGLRRLEQYLSRWAAFADWLDARPVSSRRPQP